MDRNKSLISAVEISKILGVSHSTARNLMKKGTWGEPIVISGTGPRQHIRVSRKLFDDWVNSPESKLIQVK